MRSLYVSSKLRLLGACSKLGKLDSKTQVQTAASIKVSIIEYGVRGFINLWKHYELDV